VKRILSLVFAMIVVFSLLPSISGNAQTTDGTQVSGIINTDTTWTVANSPFIVTGNILVYTGATLTIEPGVEVIFNGNFSIQVRGNLQAIGTEQERITFRHYDNGTWGGIELRANNNVLEFCDINAMLNVNNSDNFRYNSNNRIINCTMTSAQLGHGDVLRYSVIDGAGISGNTVGVNFLASGQVSNNTIINHNVGISKWSSHAFVGLQQTMGNTIKNNNIGIRLNSSGTRQTVIYNNIINNDIGIEIQWGGARLSASYNNFDNTQLNVRHQGSWGPIDFTNNYWGTTNRAEIASTIYDFYQNWDRGRVRFEPFLTISLEETLENTQRYHYHISTMRADFWTSSLSLNVTFTKNQDTDGGIIIIAFFDSNGGFLHSHRNDTFLDNREVGQTFTIWYDHTLLAPSIIAAVAEIRAFVWNDFHTMTPLSNVGVF